MLWIDDIVENTPMSPIFLPIIELTWMVLWIVTRWLLKGVHFQPLQVHKMEVNMKASIKWKIETPIFINGRGFGFTRNP